MSDVQIHLIQKINAAKKSFLNQVEIDANERLNRVKKISQLIKQLSEEELLQLDTTAHLMSRDYYLNKLIPVIPRICDRVIGTNTERTQKFLCHPSGVHAVVLNSRVLITEICELIMTSLGSGNYLFFNLQPNQENLFIKLREIIINAGFSEDSLSWIVDNKNEFKNFFYQHPAFRLATFFDFNKEVESQLTVANLLDRKWQLFRGGKSLAVVLAGTDHEFAVKTILNSIRQGQGLLAQNISRILVVEQEEDNFKTELLKQINDSDFIFRFANQAQLDLLRQMLISDKARQFGESSSIQIFENISNCSEYHQVELQAPLCFLQSIRYGFDSIKWIQAVPNCVGVQLFGADEKVAKISEKIDVPYLWKNSWIDSQDFWLLGSSGSFAGHLDPNWNGSFYSNWTKF